MQEKTLPKQENVAITLRDLKDCHWSGIQMELLEESIMLLQAKSTYRALAYRQCGGRGRTANGSNIEDCLTNIQSLEIKWRQQLQRFCHATQKVEAAIETLPEKEAAILRLRYIKALPWRSISRQVNYEESWCRKIERKALKRLGLI